jgi:hypothetical protein
MILCVFGSRCLKDKDAVTDAIEQGLFQLGLSKSTIDLVIDGKASGVDSIAHEWATRFGIPTRRFHAKWRNLNVPNVRIKRMKGSKIVYNANAGARPQRGHGTGSHALHRRP